MYEILYIDDEEYIRESSKLFLERTPGFSVTAVSSAREALDLLKTRTFDAIISDYQMPGMNGITLLKEVREQYGDLPFILFTGRSQERVVIDALNSDADFYFTKDLDFRAQFNEIIPVIRMAIDRRRARQSARENEERFRAIFACQQSGTLIIDAASHRILDVNPYLARLIGLPVDRIIGNPCHTFICPAEKGRCPITDLGQNIDNSERVLLTADGRRIPVLKTVVAVSIGDHHCLIENILNITERKQAETALKQSEEKYRVIVEDSLEGFLVLDISGTVLFANPAAARLVNLESSRECIGRNVLDFITPESREMACRNIAAAMNGQNGNIAEYQLIAEPPRDRWVEVTRKRLLFGGIPAIMVMVRDITCRKQMESEIRLLNATLEQRVKDRTEELEKEIAQRLEAEERLRASYNEKVLLLKEIHHRVKNNLQIIASLLNLQARQVTDPPTLAAIQESRSRVRTMAIVHEKLYRGKELAHVNLHDYIRLVGEDLFRIYDARARGIRFRLEIRDIYVGIDAAIPLGLIINELISNSLKYAFPGDITGEVFIGVIKEGRVTTIRYHDDGAGFPEGFDWRNSQTLGLQLVNNLVDQLGGTIDLDQGHSTRFTIIIPDKEEIRG